jgi:uncharacterized membrane protein
MTKTDWYVPFSWIMVGLSFLLSLIVCPLLGIAGPAMIFFSAVPLVLVHGYRRYGFKKNTIFIGLIVVLSTLWETLSIHTGFPFGHYHYTIQPQFLGGVPVVIPIAYIALSYICWHVANAILSEIDIRMNKAGTAFVMAILASVIMGVYDLATDSLASTVNNAWIWEQGGAFFGVPVSNYLGWMFCTFTFYILFSLLLTRKRAHERVVDSDRMSLLQFVLIYANLGLTVLIADFTRGGFGTGTVIDQAGTVWNRSAVGGSLSLIVIFGMFVLVFLALINLFRTKV